MPTGTMRHIIKFEKKDGSDEIRFPLSDRQQLSTQALRSGLYTSPGRNYAVRPIGYAPSLKSEAREQLSFTLFDASRRTEEVESKWETMVRKLHSFGVGKLWSQNIDETLRWAWAYIETMPQRRVDFVQNKYHLSTQLYFVRLSDWYAKDPITTTPFTISSNPDTFSITNGGTEYIYNAVVTLYGTFANPTTIENTTNGYRLRIARSGASDNDRIRFSAGIPAVEYSDDGGTTWTGCYADFTRKTGQVQLMKLDPGVNEFTVTGVSSGSVLVTAYNAFYG